MIQKVSFRNFKAYRSLDLELEPFTVLVGPNASGKTTLLEGVQILSEVIDEANSKRSRRVHVEHAGLHSFGVQEPIELRAEGISNDTRGALRCVSAHDERDIAAGFNNARTAFDVTSETERPPGPASVSRMMGLAVDFDEPFFSSLRATAVLHFDSRQLADASYSDEATPQVGSDGRGLASQLAQLKLSHDEIFDGIEQALKQIVPSVRRIRIERAPVEQTAIRTIALDEQHHQVTEKRRLWGHQVVLDMKGAKGVPANRAGEGTIMALGLLTVLMGPMKPRVVLLDDIELALHPVAQAKLIEVLRAIQKRDPGLQIIATSHSPFILNYLEPREVRMTFLAENGFARCEKLTAHPEFEKWKDLMSPGEFWSTVGESWLEKAGEASGSD